VPSDLGEWHSQPLDVDEPFLGSVDFSERLSRRFRRGDQEIDVLVGLDTRTARQKSLISEKTAYPGSGFDLVDAWSPAGVANADARLGVMRGEHGDRLVIHWYEDVASTPREALRQALALDRGPWRRTTPAVVVRVSTPVGSGADGHPAEARLREFLPLLRDALAQARGRGEPRAAEAAAWRG
jgi:EpsI family protein